MTIVFLIENSFHVNNRKLRKLSRFSRIKSRLTLRGSPLAAIFHAAAADEDSTKLAYLSFLSF